jgi:hypothetical protein
MMYPTPTPACEEGGEQSYRVERTKSGGFITRRVNKPHMTYGAKLSDAMLYLENKKMYPTPNTNDGATNPAEDIENWEKRAEEKKKEGINLHYALRHAVQKEEQMKMYPTPRTGAGSRPNGKGGKVLEEEVMIEAGLRERGKKLNDLTVKMIKENKVGGKLNPQFVQFLMGYPMNWTKIE